jgi:esterase/lipase superfamily enzyme
LYSYQKWRKAVLYLHERRFQSSYQRVLVWQLFLLLFLLTLNLPSFAKAKQANGFVSIPVLYVTDRQMEGETFGSHRRYPGHCAHEMYYGTANVVVPNQENQKEGETFQHLGWKLSDHKPLKIATKEKIDPADYAAAKKEFFQRVTKALDRSGSNELCVYVHGACDAFEDCAQDAATMAYYLKKPTILYSWPSNPKWRSYFIDGVNSEWSQGHFDTFCRDLLAFQKEHPVQVTMVSHSMGNRLVIRALPVLYGKGLVNNWELVSPDIDAATTRHYVMGYEEGKSPIRLYVSNKDKMLPLAQLVSGGYYRLGEAANQASLPPDWKSATPALVERIDFTAIDTGITGHSIPCALIANIIKDNKPGDNLELVPETEVRANRLIRWANRSQKLSDTTGVPPEYCKRVVKVK